MTEPPIDLESPMPPIYFILVPAAVKESPVKGAVALANQLSRERTVKFVTLKKGKNQYHGLSDKIERIPLEHLPWPRRIPRLRNRIKKASNHRQVITLSSCLSADLANLFCRDMAVTCSSVRGNLPIVYAASYGVLGKLLAEFHLRSLGLLDQAVAMTRAMARSIQKRIHRPSPVIGNFIDEHELDAHRRCAPNTGPLKFVFTGSLIKGKQPGDLILAMAHLRRMKVPARLEIYGDGPLKLELIQLAKELGISDLILFKGYVDTPFQGVSQADVLVLPSLSEGLSRSALEALYMGIPCIMRKVDGNAELIQAGKNGMLFTDVSQLPSQMLAMARFSREHHLFRQVLLPPAYRQAAATTQYMLLLEARCQCAFPTT